MTTKTEALGKLAKRKARAETVSILAMAVAIVSGFLWQIAWAMESSNKWFWLTWVYAMFIGAGVLVVAGSCYLLYGVRQHLLEHPGDYSQKWIRLSYSLMTTKWFVAIGLAFTALALIGLVAVSFAYSGSLPLGWKIETICVAVCAVSFLVVALTYLARELAKYGGKAQNGAA